MVDAISPERRSANMAHIRSRDSVPELFVRRILHGAGYRYRLHRKDLPGHPDLVFSRRRKVIFVHGCFWHQHGGCREGRLPGSNQAYWEPKLARNVQRDCDAERTLRDLGWEFLVIWECEIRMREAVAAKIAAFLGPPRYGKSLPRTASGS